MKEIDAECVSDSGRRAGPPQARPAPLGGSALREAKSVGVQFQ